MPIFYRSVALAALTSALVAGLTAAGTTARGQTPSSGSSSPAPTMPRVEPVLGMPQSPGNLTILPNGRQIVSMQAYFTPQRVLAEVRPSGELVNFPAGGEGQLPGMPAVLGIRSDTAGLLYILDNGSNSKAPPKLVLWDTRTNRLVRTIPLKSAADTNSQLNDFAFDPKRQKLYMSDPAGGSNGGLVVVDLKTGTARRALSGVRGVINEDTLLTVEGHVATKKLPNGTLQHVKIGLDGIAIDYNKEWVYLGPFMAHSLYRVRADDLANASLSAEQLASRVERYATKPFSDGITIDRAGNVYMGDIEGNGIGVVTAADRQYHVIAQGPQYKWIDDFEFAPDGYVYTIASQLHLSPALNAGKREPVLPFQMFRFRPLAPGRQGY